MSQTERLNPLVLQKRFSAQRQGSLQSAIDTLSHLDIEEFFFMREITVSPIQRGRQGYQFTCQIKRRQRLLSYTTARSEGRIWQDAAGVVFLEGTAQINGWAFALGLAVYSALLIIFLVFAGARGGLFGVLLIYHLWSFYQDYNAVSAPLVHAIETFPIEDIKPKPKPKLADDEFPPEHPLYG